MNSRNLKPNNIEQSSDYQLNLVPAPIESITGIWKFTRPANHRIHTRSLPEHLLQLVLKGSYEVRTNNRNYIVHQGDLIYYYASEDVHWLGNADPVEFYSVGFSSKAIRPFPLESRVFSSNKTIRNHFSALYQASINQTDNTPLAIHAHLAQILLEIYEKSIHTKSQNRSFAQWWNLERLLRQQQIFRPDLNQMAELSKTSRASLVRLCRKATGMSPMKRIQTIRMEEAKALLAFSSLNITEISQYLNYTRVHEFSREFGNYYAMTPTKFRNYNLNDL